MSKILLVEPYTMLQHAFVAALFPEHELKIVEDLPHAESFAADFDLVIADAAALRTRNPGQIDEWPMLGQLPIIWVDSERPTRAGSSMIGWLTPPFTREELRTAVVGLLQVVAEPAVNAIGDQVHLPPPKKARSAKTERAEAADGKTIIELVDVFEDIAEGNQGSKAKPRD